MSEENVKAMLDHVSVYNRGDYDAALAFLDPEIEWRMPSVVPDIPETVRGHQAVRESWKLADETFGGFAFEPVEMKDLGERAFGGLRAVGRGRQSGVRTEMSLYVVVEFKAGLISRIDWFQGRSEALEAAGLSE
jgi:ketosteroid isomerase-like protein